jgi:hypothetical protein
MGLPADPGLFVDRRAIPMVRPAAFAIVRGERSGVCVCKLGVTRSTQHNVDGDGRMEHYLLHLSYSSAGWAQILRQPPGFDQRMEPVRRLIAHLGGSFASFHFFDTPAFQDAARQHTVVDKFALFGTHDVMAVLAMPDKHAAQAFMLALSAQPGIATIKLISMMPFEEVITASVGASNTAIAATGYAGPGPAP